ncbi:MAG TPA: DinB family protein [Blastocatellia bacterium]|jgi:uncharacterized damage-inducible protein DinB|nr:DinB family protein [Blastocatellia bacterium]
MTLAATVTDLLRQMEWADALIWQTVLSSPAAAEDAVLHDRLYHVHVTQHAFLQVWRGVTAEMPLANTLDATSLALWAKGFYVETRPDKLELDEHMLRGSVPDSLLRKAEARLGIGATTPTICDTVLQVVTHSTYHRGQVNARLRELGCDPPLTEYFVWVWRGKPAADWPG